MIGSQGTKVRSTLTCGRTSSGLPLQLWAKPGRAHFRTHDASVSSSAPARAERRAGPLSARGDHLARRSKDSLPSKEDRTDEPNAAARDVEDPGSDNDGQELKRRDKTIVNLASPSRL